MRKGFVMLPTILVLSFIILSIALSGLFIVFTLNRSNYAIKLSGTALSVAHAGIKDASLIIIRNSNWSPAGCGSSVPSQTINTYVLNVGQNKAYICVERIGNKYTINSLGQVLNQKKYLKAVLDQDSFSGQIRLQFINEVQF